MKTRDTHEKRLAVIRDRLNRVYPGQPQVMPSFRKYRPRLEVRNYAKR